MCNKECESCPFAFTDSSEMVQNYGCLPTPQEIVRMRVEFGKTWACHSNPSKPCIGGIEYLKSKGMDYRMIDKQLVTEQSDFLVGFGKLLEAEESIKFLTERNDALLQDARHWRSVAENLRRIVRKQV